MALEDFDYKAFAEELSSQADGLLPAEFLDFQRKYVIDTIKNFSVLCAEAIVNDKEVKFDENQAMLITQMIAEWSFHKSVDIIKSGIMPDYWDRVMQKIAFTIFEIAKQTITKGLPQDEILRVVEHHVKKTYNQVLLDLKNRKYIDKETFNRALNQSNIDDMMEKIQEEKVEQELEENMQHSDHKESSKILKLASVALLLKQISQDKVQTILNKFDPNDAKTVIQYMQMQDLEEKVDTNIAIKCLKEMRVNLPEPKYISPDKIIARMKKVFEVIPREKIEQIVLKERPYVKDFINRAYDGDYSDMPTKVAAIIAQHLEESVL